MSRFVGFSFLALDLVASVTALVQSSLSLAILLLAAFASVALAALSGLLRSLLWPSYFWDSDGAPAGKRRAV